MGTIQKLNPTWAKKLVATDFRRRITDDFDRFVPEINMAQYKASYDKRDWETLANSLPTELCEDLNRVLDEILFDRTRLNPGFTTEIHINTYPYDLYDNEVVDIIDSIREISRTIFFIKAVNIPPYTVTLKTIKDNNWKAMFVYDCNLYLNSMLTQEAVSLGKIRCNDTFLHAPQIALNYEELKNVVIQSELEGKKFDPFIHLTLVTSPFIALEYVSSEYYSLVDVTTHAKTDDFEDQLNTP